MPIFRVRSGFVIDGRYRPGELIEAVPADAARLAHMLEPAEPDADQRVARYQQPARNAVTIKLKFSLQNDMKAMEIVTWGQFFLGRLCP